MLRCSLCDSAAIQHREMLLVNDRRERFHARADDALAQHYDRTLTACLTIF